MKIIQLSAWFILVCSLSLAGCTPRETVSTAGQADTASPAARVITSRVEPSLAASTPTQLNPPTSAETKTEAPSPTSSQVPPTQTVNAPATIGSSPYPPPPVDTVIPSPTETQAITVSPTETPLPTLPLVVTPGEGTELAPGGWQPASGSYPAPGVETAGSFEQPAISPTPIPPTPTIGVTHTSAPAPIPTQTQPSSAYPGPATSPTPVTPSTVPISPTAQAGGSQSNSPYPAPGNTPVPTSTPGFGPSLTPAPTSPGFPVTPTPVITGTVTQTPFTPLVVRVTQKVTNPASVRLDAGQLQLVEFFATWSNLSKSMAPVLNGLEARYNGRVLFTYLDVDNKANIQFKQVLGYQFPPHLFLLDGQGQVLKVWKGYVRVEDLEAAFASQEVTP